uniref:Uncharacterized protein n=1 Tax=Oryza brachyantha TaxID=4533 RepID=J3LWB9_ORYBR
MVATETCVDEVHVCHLGENGEKGGADVVLKGHEAEGYSTVDFASVILDIEHEFVLLLHSSLAILNASTNT